MDATTTVALDSEEGRPAVAPGVERWGGADGRRVFWGQPPVAFTTALQTADVRREAFAALPLNVSESGELLR